MVFQNPQLAYLCLVVSICAMFMWAASEGRQK